MPIQRLSFVHASLGLHGEIGCPRGTASTIHFSNSMIEAWWRVLKHNWLFLHPLDSVAKVRSLVEFYVAEHNERLPHSAFKGQTPDEVYFGRGEELPAELEVARQKARATRLEENRSRRCAACG